jgi:hypothetical protein
LVHWIAADGQHVLSVMSIAIIRKLPSPENLRGRWGYISNCYVLSEARNASFGRQSLTAIEAWARRRPGASAGLAQRTRLSFL